MDMKKAVKFTYLPVLVFMILSLTGCISSGNNYLHPADFARKLQQDGFQIRGVRRLDPTPLGAGEALEIAIGNSNIGVYKYDIYNKAQAARLKKIDADKRVYFVGIPYPVYEVSGSFIVVGLDKHKDKRRILESLRNFR